MPKCLSFELTPDIMVRNQPPMQWIKRVIALGERRSSHEAEHLLPPNTSFKNA